ncbi:hypothetical protein ASZ90_018311 [hydrocarbon metagenome]|uniref:DUF4044 domain-containing protein n=1 Tax=hydrocarbon metagenome TaxID=938273 RepID=A0A0W8E6N0_9ZZZZ
MSFMKSARGKKKQRIFLFVVAGLVIISFLSSIIAVNFI